MKLSILVVIAIIVVACGFFVVRNSSSQQATTIPTATTSAEEVPYQLVVLVDSVSLRRVTETKSQPVHGIVEVGEGDTVITSSTGRARLVWPNETITTLEEDSQVVIKELSNSGAQSRIELIVGDIWSKVTRILGSGEYYEVETQDTVAAVRGTVFRTTYRNKNARIQAIEHTVRVFARTANGVIDERSGADISENNEATLAHTATVRKFAPKQITTTDRNDLIFERIQRERGQNMRQLMQTMQPTPTPKQTIIPTQKPIPTPTPTPTPTPPPEVTDGTATPTPAETPNIPKVQLDSIFPRTVSVGSTFSLEGANFLTGRFVPHIARVLVGGISAEFHIITGGTSIFVTVPQLSAGIYDVSVETVDGDTVSLQRAATIQ